MKKNYTVSLEKEQVEELQRFLNTFDITLSGFFNGILEESLMRCREITCMMNDEGLPFKLARTKMITDKMYPSVMIF